MNEEHGPPRVLSDAFDGDDELRDLVSELKEEGLGPDGLARVAASLPSGPLGAAGPGGSGAGSGGSASTVTTTASTSASVVVKVGTLIVVVGLVGGGAAFMSRDPVDTGSAPSPEDVSEAALAPEEPSPTRATTEDPIGPPGEPMDETAIQPDTSDGPPSSPRVSPRRRRGPTASAPVEDELVEEDRLLRRARAALSGNPGRALSLTEEHRRQFPRGVLIQEREVVAIDALHRLGRATRARERAERFISTWPGSAHRPRLEAIGYP